ncbi:MAG: ATP-dependent RecD-like DNA helicase [Geminicoccaceae bacterium]
MAQRSFTLSSGPESLSGLVERVMFHNPDTGFAVLRIRPQGRKDSVTVVGRAPAINPGEVIRAEGAWEQDRSWGEQFRASWLTSLPPTTREGIAAYLGSGIIAGIGPSLAGRLVEAFGEHVFEVMDQRPARLEEVDGIGKKTAARIAESWKKQRAVHDVMLFLHSHGISPMRAARIHEAYGDAAVELISKDPYRLARDIRGIGFHAADQLAERLGLAGESPLRLRAALAHVLSEATMDGHCALPRGELLRSTRELIGGSFEATQTALDDEIAQGGLIAETIGEAPCVFLTTLHAAEIDVADALRARASGQPPWNVQTPSARLEEIERLLEITLAERQRDAVLTALTSQVLVITGGPGTGKTTLVRSVLGALPLDVVEVRLAAPTGRAARRLSESTGLEAKTLHRLLEADPQRGFARGKDRPLHCDLLVVDEASMVDIQLMQATVNALPDSAALMLVGDVDQLPSIGPGRVLGDIIESGAIPTVQLDEIFRQAASSRIVTTAHAINAGSLPDLAHPEAGLSDFYAIGARSAEDASAKVVELVTRRIPERFGVDPISDVQVLSPTNKGVAGAQSLNERLQDALNPQPVHVLERHGRRYALGDKVMQLENDYEREVNNGDIGRITGVDLERRQLDVLIDGRTQTYAQDELDALAPAYAITVHKSQGSEYPVIVLPLCAQHGRMLRRNLVYTAITRAKKLAILVAEPQALAIAVRERPSEFRWSNLVARLRADDTQSPAEAEQGE